MFKKFYSKVIDPNTMPIWRVEATEAMSIIEKVFPPVALMSWHT
jgi:hypothetical protein